MNRKAVPYFIGLIFGLIALISSFALAATDPTQTPAAFGLTAPALSIFVGLAAGLIVRPVTSVLKNIFGVEGVNTKILAVLINIVINGYLAFTTNVYTDTGLKGLWAFLVATVTAYLKAEGDHIAAKAAAQ